MRLASGTRRYGRVLVGGRPRRVMRLTERGLAALDELQAGRPTPAARRLARTLLDAGLVHPDGARLTAASSYGSGAGRDAGDRAFRVAAVVPVRDRPAELARALEALGAAGVPVDPIIVVDDGSVAPEQLVTLVVDYPTVRLVRRPRSGGPAAARNTGFRALHSFGYDGAGVLRDDKADEQAPDFVVLVDSDVEALTPGWVARLLPHFVDPTLAAVAPRVVARPACTQPPRRVARARASCLASFARWHSPLDLGEQPAQVTPTGGVAYVPTAALVVRADALGLDRATTRPILDEQLRYGEDVDLVWRWYDAGWRVRYEPSVLVGHRDPDRWTQWLVRRYRYGTSAGPLARRHPGRVAPLVLTPVGVLTLGALAAGRYRWAARLAAFGAAQAVRAWTGAGVPVGPAVGLAVEGLAEMVLGAGRALGQLGLPVAAVAAVRWRRARLGLVGLVLTPIVADWARLKVTGAHVTGAHVTGAHETRLSLPGLCCWLVASLADDLAYGTGVWRGVLSARTTGPLRPRWVRMGRARRTRATGSAQKTTTPRRFTPSRMSW